MSERVREEDIEMIRHAADLLASKGVLGAKSLRDIADRLAARPASAEKIASVVRAWPWPEQRAQLEAMLVRTEAYTTPPAAAQDRELLDLLDRGCWQLDFDEDERTVDRIHGGINDRQWTEVGRGRDLRDALTMALNAARAAGATDGK